jgi:hypothetical protein
MAVDELFMLAFSRFLSFCSCEAVIVHVGCHCSSELSLFMLAVIVHVNYHCSCYHC